MSSYLEKYHLQKVEPVKNRNKQSATNNNKLKDKLDKGNLFKIPIKQILQSQSHFIQQRHQNTRSAYPQHKTEQTIRSPYMSPFRPSSKN